MKLRIPDRVLRKEEYFRKEEHYSSKTFDYVLNPDTNTYESREVENDPTVPMVTITREHHCVPSQEMRDWADEHFVTIVAENPKQLPTVGGTVVAYEYYAEGDEENVILMRLRFSF